MQDLQQRIKPQTFYLVCVALGCLVACLSIAIPLLAAVVAPTWMTPRLQTMRAWLERNNSTIMAILLIVIGAIVAGGALLNL